MKLKTEFVPVCPTDIKKNEWDELDIILITGDAYVDHPAFGVALLSRFLIEHKFRVGIIAQPQSDEDYQALGRPKLFFGITSGNMDSMVNHYTAQKKIRSEDAFSPNNRTGLRPDRAVQIYTQKVKQFYKNICVVIGGVEASMRRIPHYDFWSDKVKNSILIDSKASILVYGSGERQILEIAERLRDDKGLEGIRGSCILLGVQNCSNSEFGMRNAELPTPIKLTDYSTVSSTENFYKMTRVFTENVNDRILYYHHLNKVFIHYPPAKPLSTQEIDAIYELPFTREPHPMYKGKPIKAFEQIKYSVLSHRGCYGGCSFCMIGFHQGKTIQSRSKDSILKEINTIYQKKYYKGTITDIAGASANMYGTECRVKGMGNVEFEKGGANGDKSLKRVVRRVNSTQAGEVLSATCHRLSCLYPEICPNLNYSDKPYLALLKAARLSAKTNNVFISSGVRFDLALKQPDFLQELCFFHTSGLLKLAPEHISENVLNKMHKPPIQKYIQFSDIYNELCKKLEKKQHILPYLIVGFPGSTLQDAYQLHLFLKENNLHVEQIQEFTPTPMTIATMMYYTGLDYATGEKIFVPKGREIRLQKALAQWFMKDNKKLVNEAMRELGVKS